MSLLKYSWFRIFLGLLLLWVCSSYFEQSFKAKNFEQAYNIQTFQHASGWGYEVFYKQKRFIHQTFIPGVRGNQSFISQEQAHKVAQLVQWKLKHQKKPSIKLSELDSLKIDYQISQ